MWSYLQSVPTEYWYALATFVAYTGLQVLHKYNLRVPVLEQLFDFVATVPDPNEPVDQANPVVKEVSPVVSELVKVLKGMTSSDPATKAELAVIVNLLEKLTSTDSVPTHRVVPEPTVRA